MYSASNVNWSGAFGGQPEESLEFYLTTECAVYRIDLYSTYESVTASAGSPADSLIYLCPRALLPLRASPSPCAPLLPCTSPTFAPTRAPSCALPRTPPRAPRAPLCAPPCVPRAPSRAPPHALSRCPLVYLVHVFEVFREVFL